MAIIKQMSNDQINEKSMDKIIIISKINIFYNELTISINLFTI